MISITIFDSNTGHVTQVTAVNQSMNLSFDADSSFQLAVEQARDEFRAYANELPQRAPRRELPQSRVEQPDRNRVRSSSRLGDFLSR